MSSRSGGSGRTYRNPWIPDEALRALDAEQGPILDVGGSAPYARAAHILDAQPFSAESLMRNAWGGAPAQPWTESQYTRFDLCSGKPWPFEDKRFALGLCSHCLEDLRDPLPALRELVRVSRRVLVICPSRLLEQARGVDHPRYCGFPRHPWMVEREGGTLVFRQKTPLVELRGCHIRCPLGKSLRRDLGAMWAAADSLGGVTRTFWTNMQDWEDYRAFVAPYRGRRDLFVRDGYAHTPRYWIWRMRQRWMGAP